MRKEYYILPFVAFLFFSVPSFAQTTVFLKVAGIAGESLDKAHPKEIEAASFANEALVDCVVSGGTGGSTCGKVKTGNFAFDMKLSSASIGLRKQMFTGKSISTIDISFEKTGAQQVDYYKIKLEEVYVVRMSESGGTDGVVDQVEFQASKVTWTYYPQDSKGGITTPVTFSWDIKTNSAN